MKRSEVIELVLMLAAAMPHRNVESSTLKVYQEKLLDLEVGPARQAINRLIGTKDFFPTIAEIRRTYADLVRGPRGTGEQAYQTALQAVRSIGRTYGGEPAPIFQDPLINRAVGIFGTWNDFCNSPTDDPGGRARFIELYDQLANAAREDFVSGIPLPKAGEQTPLFGAPKPAAPKPAPLPVPLPELRSAPRHRHPDIQHRKYTAEELDEAIARK